MNHPITLIFVNKGKKEIPGIVRLPQTLIEYGFTNLIINNESCIIRTTLDILYYRTCLFRITIYELSSIKTSNFITAVIYMSFNFYEK